jgi:carboxymethylenebutenolidase
MPDIRINALNGKEFGAYTALPKGGHGPGLIVIQEIFGVNAVMRQICDDFAAKGFLAVCPDLYWRQEPDVQLTDKTASEWEHALALCNAFDAEAGTRDLLATLAHIRRMPGCGGKVGAIGYCLGGKLAFLMATRSDADCTISYYGVGLESLLNEWHDIRLPLMMHMGEADEFATAPGREKILGTVARNPVVTAHTYPGAKHAFARPGGQNYHPEAAALANKRTEEFLTQHLLA